MSSGWEKGEILILSGTPLHQITDTLSDYLSILGNIGSFHISIGSSRYPLPISGSWFHDQFRTVGFKHQGTSFYDNL